MTSERPMLACSMGELTFFPGVNEFGLEDDLWELKEFSDCSIGSDLP
jgi:hypothetical protein